MDFLCKSMGVVDLAAALVIFLSVESSLKFFIVVPLVIKGAISLLG